MTHAYRLLVGWATKRGQRPCQFVDLERSRFRKIALLFFSSEAARIANGPPRSLCQNKRRQTDRQTDRTTTVPSLRMRAEGENP